MYTKQTQRFDSDTITRPICLPNQAPCVALRWSVLCSCVTLSRVPSPQELMSRPQTPLEAM